MTMQNARIKAPLACLPQADATIILHFDLYTFHCFGRLAPYFDLCCFLAETPCVSSMPRTIWYRTPGRSLTRPPRIITTECSCKLCPSPGMYAVTSMPFVNRTRAIFRSAEFGFLGVVV